MFRDHLNELDVLEPAADRDFDPFGAAFHQAIRGGFYVTHGG
jgi:hypothetical protein